MGRAKLNMELIPKEKSRNNTFKKRKEGLIRKMHEFTTLCDVMACIIIYGPNPDKAAAAEPEIWPPNPDQVRQIIDIYKSKNKDSSNKTFGLSDFFQDRARKIEEELAKLRKKNMEAKYPTWLDFLNTWTEPQLRLLADEVSDKAEEVKSRIELLRRSREGFGSGLDMNMNVMDFSNARMFSQSEQQFMNFYEMGIFKQQASISAVKAPFEMFQYPPLPAVDYHQGPMMATLFNENEFAAGAGPSGGNIQCAATTSYKRPKVIYDTAAAAGGMMDHHDMCQSPMTLQARYFGTAVMGPAVPPLAPPYAMPVQVPMQLQFSGKVESYDGGGHGQQNTASGGGGQFQMIGKNDRQQGF